MEISSTAFELVSYGEDVERGTDDTGRYVFHPLSVKNKIIINDKEFGITYSTGQSNNHDNFSCPANFLELDGTGTDTALLIIATLNKDSLLARKDRSYQSHDEYINEILEELAHVGCSEIKTEQDIVQLLVWMRDEENHPDFSDYVSDADCECEQLDCED